MCEGERQFSAVCIAMFNASFIISVFRYKFFFVNLVVSVLVSSLLKCAVFHVLSSVDENKDESYREHQSRLSNKSLLSVESHLILKQFIRKMTETKKK